MNPNRLEDYLRGIENEERDFRHVDRLSEAEARGEAVFLGLRTSPGLSASAFETEFGSTPRSFYPEQIDRLVAAELLAETRAGDLRLTDRGVLLSDTVFADFV